MSALTVLGALLVAAPSVAVIALIATLDEWRVVLVAVGWTALIVGCIFAGLLLMGLAP